ncbi:MAG: Lytic transglycosylase catalytic [Solirubrobacterales bacterium]|nr:Lytic transglycosylase catalytic [Solirubrobacterales bacterium]
MTITIDAVARVAQLQTMIATVQGGAVPAGGATFASQLATATGAPATTIAAPAGGAAVPFGAEIDAAAARHGIDPALLRGLVRQESGFDPGARSGAGAVGLTQLMPGTARELGVTDPTDPLQALEGGAKYLKAQLDRFGGDAAKALAAYNAGPGAVQKFGGVPPYAETQAYVRKVLAFAAEYGGSASAIMPAAGGPPASSPTQWGTT